MLTLIDKQQVKRRPSHSTTGFRQESAFLAPRFTRHQHVGSVRGRTGRHDSRDIEPTLFPVTVQTPDSALFVEPNTNHTPTANQATPGGTWKLLSRFRPRPMAAAAAAVVFAAGLLVILTANTVVIRKPLSQPTPLPADGNIERLLAAYAEPAAPPHPTAVVRLPQTNILKALKTHAYTVQKGDTIGRIAKAAGRSIETVISFNGVTDVRLLTPGTKLKIPSVNGILYTVQPGDTLGRIAQENRVKLTEVLDANALKTAVITPGQELFLPGGHLSSTALRKALGTLFEWPAVGRITSPFGMRRDPFTQVVEFHNGVDIANRVGTPVRAAMDGTVAATGTNRGYGNYIILDNSGGYQTLYGHLSKWLVQHGQVVRAGQEIGVMGSTGYATGPHLHFTIYKDSTPVNPMRYLPKR